MPFQPVGIPTPLGRCRDRGVLHSPGVALPDFNDLGLILPFFPLFVLLTPPQSLALEGYYCLCRSVPGHPHWQMLDLKSMDEKLSRHIRARGGEGLSLLRGWGTPPARHNLPSPASPRKTFLLEINLKKKSDQNPHQHQEKNHKQLPGKFSEESLTKKGKGWGKTGSIFLPGSNTADLLAQEMHSW